MEKISFWLLGICMLLMSACADEVDVHKNPNFVGWSIYDAANSVDQGIVRYETFSPNNMVTLYFIDSLGKYQIGDTITLIKK